MFSVSTIEPSNAERISEDEAKKETSKDPDHRMQKTAIRMELQSPLPRRLGRSVNPIVDVKSLGKREIKPFFVLPVRSAILPGLGFGPSAGSLP